jgi:hypothetical protein
MRRVAVAAVLLSTACSEYDLSKGIDAPAPGDPTVSATHTDDTGTPDTIDTADTTIPDTGTPDTGHADTGETDPCLEPEDGYATNPEARIIVTDGSRRVHVEFVSSDTSYQDELQLDSPEDVFLVHAWRASPGASFNLGPYASESEMVFGINITNTGEHWESGPASRNADGVPHVAVTYEGHCSWLIGFEDLTGGGDRDYNDVVLRVEGPLRQDR